MSLREIMQKYKISAQGGNLYGGVMPTYNIHLDGDPSNEGHKIEPNSLPHNIAVVLHYMLQQGVDGDLTTVKNIGEEDMNLFDHSAFAIDTHNESNTKQLEVPHIEEVLGYLPANITQDLKEKYGL